MNDSKPCIVWFRQDLRIADNPALAAAVESGQPVLPVYILDDENAGAWQMGAASRWWLHESLASLNHSLRGRLRLFRGNALDILPELVAKAGAAGVTWNRCYEPWRIRRDRDIKRTLKADDIHVESFNGSLLFEPQTVLKKDGTPYKVFTPFYRKGCLEAAPAPGQPISAPKPVEIQESSEGLELDELGLMPRIRWYPDQEPPEKVKLFIRGGRVAGHA